jgi:hypothetical protein
MKPESSLPSPQLQAATQCRVSKHAVTLCPFVSISAKLQTGGSSLVGCSQPTQNIRICYLYVAEGLPFHPYPENARCSREETTGSGRINCGYRNCSVISQGERKGVYLGGSLSMYSRKWPRNLNLNVEGLVLTPSQKITLSVPCLTIRTNECTHFY